MEFAYGENSDGFLVTLSYRQQKIASVLRSREGISQLLEHIRIAPGRGIPQPAKGIGIPPKTAERWIKDLKRRGCIEYRGSKKAGGYFAVVEHLKDKSG